MMNAGPSKGNEKESLTSLLGNVTSTSHSDSNVSGLECRSVVDTVPSHGHRIVAAGLDFFNNTQLLLWGRARKHNFGVRPNDNVPVFGSQRLNVVSRKDEGAEWVIVRGLDSRRRGIREYLHSAGIAQVVEGVDLLLSDDSDL